METAHGVGASYLHMPFVVLIVAMLAAPAQDTAVSSAGVILNQAAPAIPPGIEPPVILPVSLERIRELLAVPTPLHESILRRPTFKIEVEEEHHVQQLLSNLDFSESRAPVPPGGIYHYETQRVMMSALGRPLMQPFAAFNGGELVTLAIQGLIGKYLGWRAIDSITAADRARAESAAKAEVARAIGSYCSGLPDKGAEIRMCTTEPAH